ncbi:MAG: 3'(2'),5'-bisphosphate nucleotidase CysQ [Leptospiraceae bacterium]|nr:3'(2'),5'-bisphosphate nucleotidase CysQ [Leptospiraceae bacterium]
MYETVLFAGKRLMDFFGKKELFVRHKDKENPVSEADLTVNAIILDSIAHYFPQDSYVSEETEETSRPTKNKEYRWVIDPLDGTKPFLRGRDEFSISVGLLYHDIPALGFIYNPAKEFYLCGGYGMGIYFFHERLDLTQAPTKKPDEIRIVVSRTELKENLFEDLSSFSLTGISSVAYKIALVVKGNFDLFISRRPKNEWDIAAGAALLRERGFFLYDSFFEPISFHNDHPQKTGIICGDPQYLDILKSIWHQNF